MQVLAHDIHHYDRRLELALKKLRDDKSVSAANRKGVLDYIKFRDAQGLSIPRLVRYIFTLRKLSRLLKGKDYVAATKKGRGSIGSLAMLLPEQC